MDFMSYEITGQETLDAFKKVKNVVCLNSILENVPENVIVIGKVCIDIDEGEEEPIIGFGDISDLKISDGKKIVAIIPKIGTNEEELDEILKLDTNEEKETESSEETTEESEE